MNSRHKYTTNEFTQKNGIAANVTERHLRPFFTVTNNKLQSTIYTTSERIVSYPKQLSNFGETNEGSQFLL